MLKISFFQRDRFTKSANNAIYYSKIIEENEILGRESDTKSYQYLDKNSVNIGTPAKNIKEIELSLC